jgi:hypothetical protein
MKPKEQRRVPEGELKKLVSTDVVILLRMVFAPSPCDVAANQRTIAASGVAPFTKRLLNHPEVTQGSGGRTADRAAATGAVAAAAGDVNVAALNRDGIRELAKQKWNKERGMRNGMLIDYGGLALNNLDDEEVAQLRAMGKVKAKGGAMFAASQQINNPDGLEFTGYTVRAVATRVASANFEKEKKQAADAELRQVTETTAAGRGTGGCGRAGRGGPGERIPWKAVAAERNAQHQDEVAALQARICELEAERAGGGAPAADGEWSI